MMNMPPLDLDTAMDVAMDAVRAGCSVLAEGSKRLERLGKTSKSPGDVSTEIDRLAESAILGRIRETFPSHAAVGEESGASGQSPFRWIVDPLDGTMNYIRGLPYYGVSVALQEHDTVVLGVVADPEREEFFTAIRGRGAFCNNKRIQVSRCPRLDEAVVGTVVPPPKWPGLDNYLEMFCRVARNAAAVRRAGAAALDLAYVASGRLDAFFVLSLKTWDVAAGSLLVTEAGGAIADIDGRPDPLETNRLVAATPGVLPQLLFTLRNVSG
ncbi:MAG: inositol monophosphatase [Desulfovibrio sp.]|nr:inositol monophosphatase [Desulfovibrio sp.]MBI4961176.1 inositol monophosphatase [Desulfovibrio sp.]